MRVIICKNKEEIADKAYKIFKQQLNEKPNSVLGLATGSSPIGLYEKLIEGYENNEVDFSEVVTFNLDEYVGIAKEHPESYYSFMHKNLFDKVNIKESNIHMPSGDSEVDCIKYEEMLSNNLIDLQVLGIGRNGHIGFNEPGTSFESETHIVDLKASTIEDNARFFDNNIELVPKKAISMGIASIMKSKKIVLIAMGENKADAIAELIKGDVSEKCPATILQKHQDVTIIIDEKAAEKC